LPDIYFELDAPGASLSRKTRLHGKSWCLANRRAEDGSAWWRLA